MLLRTFLKRQALILKVVRVFLLGVLSVPPRPPDVCVDKTAGATEPIAAAAADNVDVATSSTDSASNVDATSIAGSVTGRSSDEWREATVYPGILECDTTEGGDGQATPPPATEVSPDDGDDSAAFAATPIVGIGLSAPGRGSGSSVEVRQGLQERIVQGLGKVRRKGLWESLPRDVRDAVLATAEFSALQVGTTNCAIAMKLLWKKKAEEGAACCLAAVVPTGFAMCLGTSWWHWSKVCCYSLWCCRYHTCGCTEEYALVFVLGVIHSTERKCRILPYF